MPQPRFLDVPAAGAKPRVSRLTHVLDKGMAPHDVEVLARRAADHIDVWKMGWGMAYLEPDMEEKLAILSRHGIRACLGGTLLEVAWLQGKAEACLSWAEDLGFPCVEVSNGAAGMPLSEKRRLISLAVRRFTVLAEVGSKDPSVPVVASSWSEEMIGDLEAGANWVLTEGRESGTVGLFATDGNIRLELAEELCRSVIQVVGLARVVFEAPLKHQQTWLIHRLGPDVNLGNVPPSEVFALEALRLGLRADTIDLARRPRADAARETSADTGR